MLNRRDLVMTAAGGLAGGLAASSAAAEPLAAGLRFPTGDSAALDKAVLPQGLAVVDEFGVLRIGDGATPGGVKIAGYAQSALTQEALAKRAAPTAAVRTTGFRAPGDGGGADFYYDPASTAKPDGYDVLAPAAPAARGAAAPPPASGRVLRYFNQAPRPQHYLGGSMADAIERAARRAAADYGELEFDRPYEVTRDLLLPGGVAYRGKPGAVVDGSKRRDALRGDFLRGMIKIGGARGGPVLLQADVAPSLKATVRSIVKSGASATVSTYGPHGLKSGDLVWLSWGASSASLPANGLYYANQALSTERMALTFPHVATVTSADSYRIAVDPAAPDGAVEGGSGWRSWANDRVLVTAAPHGLKPGDWVELSSSRLVPQIAGAQPVRYGEAARVTRVFDARRAVLDRPLKYTYLVSEAAQFRKLDLAPAFTLRDLEIRGRGSILDDGPNLGDTGLSVDLAEDFLIENVSVQDCAYFGFSFHRFNTGVANRLRFRCGLADDGGRVSGKTRETYGMVWGSWFNKMTFNDPIGEGNARHHFCEATHGAGVSNDYMAGLSGVLELNNPTFIGSTSNCIATHYPNDGFRVRGGFVSGDEFGLDARAGNVDVEGLQGSGGWGLINLYGFCTDVRIANVRGRNYQLAGVRVLPSGGARFTPPDILIEGVWIRRAREAVYIFSENTDHAMRAVVRDVRYADIEFTPVRVASPAAKKGSCEVSGVRGRDSNRNDARNCVAVELVNQEEVWLDDIRGEPSGAQVEYGFSATGCEGVKLGERVRRRQPIDSLTIVGGTLTLARADDFMAYVRGENQQPDDLDRIVGLQPGQRVTLIRYDEAIRIRDQAQAGGGWRDGVVQTPGDVPILLDGPFQAVVALGISPAPGAVHVVVESVPPKL